MNRQKKINYLFLSALLVASSVFPLTNVKADSTNNTSAERKVNVGFEQGEFTLKTSNAIGFGTHKIENKRKVVKTNFDGDFGVIDARGTQEGWSVTVEATPFTIIEPSSGWAIVDGISTSGYQLPMGSLSLASLTTIAGANQEPAQYHPSIEFVDKAIDLNQAIKIAVADKGKGMGEYVLTYGVDSLCLVIDPLTAKVDNINYPDTVTPYESTLTWNLISGPDGDENPIQNISDFEYEVIDGFGIGITAYKGLSKNVNIPSEIEGQPVVAIGNEAFMSKNLLSVKLPNSIITIGNSAFRDNSIKILTMPTSLTHVGNNAFRDNEISSVIVTTSSLIEVGDNAFTDNLLIVMDIPYGVETIGDNAFSNNKLTFVHMPDTITSIGIGAFMNNEIDTLKLSNNLTKISDMLFYNNKLVQVVIPESVTHIGDNAFEYNKLANITISDNVASIGTHSFAYNLLTDVGIGKNVQTIGLNAFKFNDTSTIVRNSSSLTVDSYFDSTAIIRN